MSARQPLAATRRTLARWAAAAAGGGGWLLSPPAAGPVRAASSAIVLTVRPPMPVWTPVAMQLGWEATAPFRRAHPGVEVQLVNTNTIQPQGQTIAAMLAGQGIDVVWDWVLPPYVQYGLLLDIEPYVRRDNLSLDVFPAGEMNFFRSAASYSPTGAGLYAVPAYLHTSMQLVNLGVLDDFGLKYPEPDWTWQDWEKMWRAVTLRSDNPSRQRFGGQLDWSGYDYNYDNPSPYIFRGFGGEYVDPTDNTRCMLGAPGSVACGEWAYALRHDQVLGNGNFATGQQVTEIACTCGGLAGYLASLRGVKWDVFPMPVWPQGRYNFAASDFYGIWSGTKYPELAWELLKFLAFQPSWQLAVSVKLGWNGPALKSLWGDWVEVIEAVAPSMRSKNLRSVQQSVLNNEPYFGFIFRYNDSEAAGIIHEYSQLAQEYKTTVAAAYQQAAHRVDQVEAAGAATAGQNLRELAAFESYLRRARAAGGATLVTPPPLHADAGVPATPAPQLVRTLPARRAYVLRAAGAGIVNASDSGTFAGAAYRKSRGVFQARLTAIAAPGARTVAAGAKVGLMARSSLSSEAAMVCLEVAVARGVHFETRPILASDTVDGWRGGPGVSNPTSATSPTGLIGASVILAPNTEKAANYLLRPVWLRLAVDAGYWRGFTSLDGVHWAPAGTPALVEGEGMWVGLFATSHQSGQYIAATFDQLAGFLPDTFVQIGTP